MKNEAEEEGTEGPHAAEVEEIRAVGALREQLEDHVHVAHLFFLSPFFQEQNKLTAPAFLKQLP